MLAQLLPTPSSPFQTFYLLYLFTSSHVSLLELHCFLCSLTCRASWRLNTVHGPGLAELKNLRCFTFSTFSRLHLFTFFTFVPVQPRTYRGCPSYKNLPCFTFFTFSLFHLLVYFITCECVPISPRFTFCLSSPLNLFQPLHFFSLSTWTPLHCSPFSTFQVFPRFTFFAFPPVRACICGFYNLP